MFRMSTLVHVHLIDGHIHLVFDKVLRQDLKGVDVLLEEFLVGDAGSVVCRKTALIEEAFLLKLKLDSTEIKQRFTCRRRGRSLTFLTRTAWL